jgi:hypothetical protein
MDRHGVRRDNVALLREGAQIDGSSVAKEQVDHSTASLADEMIVLAGLGIESGSLFVQTEGADLTLLDETVKVAINGGETDPRQLFVNPPVDLMGERVSVIALESVEHLFQLACPTFAGGPLHRLTSTSWLPGGSDRTVNESGYQIDGFLSSDSPGAPVSSGGGEGEELGLSADATKQTVNVIAASAVPPAGEPSGTITPAQASSSSSPDAVWQSGRSTMTWKARLSPQASGALSSTTRTLRPCRSKAAFLPQTHPFGGQLKTRLLLAEIVSRRDRQIAQCREERHHDKAPQCPGSFYRNIGTVE